MCVYTHTYVLVCAYVSSYTHLYIYMYAQMCVCIYIYVCVCVCDCTCECRWIYTTYIYIHTHICNNVCVYICVYNTCACGTRRATWFTCYSSRSQDGISSPRSQGWCSTEGPKLRPAAKAATVPEAIVQGSRVLVEEDKGLG